MSRKSDYSKYLKSDEWCEKRDKILKERKVCELCEDAENLHVHHLTYENLHNEKEEDLILLCKSCHFAVHKGVYVVIRNICGKGFFRSEYSEEILKSLQYTKIKRIYFTKDKTLIVKGDNVCIEREEGTVETLDDNKWYMFINE